MGTLCWPQVLLDDCTTQDLAEQASGVVQAVLQGRNSAVLALGQPGSGKTHTLLSSDLHDVHASSSAGGVSMHQLLSQIMPWRYQTVSSNMYGLCLLVRVYFTGTHVSRAAYSMDLGLQGR